VFGARMVGGGWGGSVVALVEPTATDRVAETVRVGYRDRTGIDCEIHAAEFGDGLAVERLE